MADSPGIDANLVQEHLQRLSGYFSGGGTAALVQTGLELGLFAAMRDAGPLTSGQLADRTGLHERWVREWLYQQTAAKVLDFVGEEPERFVLSREAAAVLLEEDSPAFMPMLRFFQQHMALSGEVTNAFRTGVGYSFDEGGDWRAAQNDLALGAGIDGPGSTESSRT